MNFGGGGSTWRGRRAPARTYPDSCGRHWTAPTGGWWARGPLSQTLVLAWRRDRGSLAGRCVAFRPFPSALASSSLSAPWADLQSVT